MIDTSWPWIVGLVLAGIALAFLLHWLGRRRAARKAADQATRREVTARLREDLQPPRRASSARRPLDDRPRTTPTGGRRPSTSRPESRPPVDDSTGALFTTGAHPGSPYFTGYDAGHDDRPAGRGMDDPAFGSAFGGGHSSGHDAGGSGGSGYAGSTGGGGSSYGGGDSGGSYGGGGGGGGGGE